MTLGGGLAVGWAYAELWVELPVRPWSGLAWLGLMVLCLGPSVLIAELRPLMFLVDGGGAILNMLALEVGARFVLELLMLATATGALASCLLSRRPRGAGSMAVSAFVFALGPGHNISFLGATFGSAKSVAIFLLVVGAASITLVEGVFRLDKARVR